MDYSDLEPGRIDVYDYTNVYEDYTECYCPW